MDEDIVTRVNTINFNLSVPQLYRGNGMEENFSQPMYENNVWTINNRAES